MAINLSDIQKQNQKKAQDEFNYNYKNVGGLWLRTDQSLADERKRKEEEERLKKLQKEQNSFFKSGDSNVGSGLLASTGDFLLDIGQGFFRTLEGLSDTAQYFASDSQKKGAKKLEKVFGQNAVSDFYNDMSNWFKQNAEFNSTGALFGTNENVEDNLTSKEWREDINKASYLGGMSDSIGEGLGNIGAMAALSAVGGGAMGAAGVGVTEAGALTTGGKFALSFGNSFTSAYGNARSEAYKNGATDEEANRFGIINGLAEGISEQFFDSMPGVKSAGFADKIGIKDFVANKLKTGLGTNVAKTFLKLVGGFEEGAEEMISNALVSVGQDIMHKLDENYTYGMDDLTGNVVEDFKKSFVSDDSIKSFISAGFTSAILGVGGDILTTAQTNQVVNAFSKDNNMSFKEAKSLLLGGTLNQAEQQVQREVKAGRGEINNNVELEEAAQKRIINYMKAHQGQNIESHIEDLVREEAKKQNKQFTELELKQEADKIRSQYVDEVNNPERYRTFTQKAENEKDDTIIKQMQEANFNDSQETHHIYNFAKKLTEANPNAKIRFVNNEILKQEGKAAVDAEGNVRGINGAYVNGEILINRDAKNPLEAVAYHEIGHAIKESSPELYKDLTNLVYQLKGQDGLKQYRELYGVKEGEVASNLTDNVEDEYVNDKLGEILNDDKYINNLTENRNLLQKIIDELKRVIKYITSGKEQKQLMKVQKRLEEVYKQGYQEAGFEGSGNTAFSLNKQSKQKLEQDFKDLTGDSILVADAKLGNYAFQQMQGKEVSPPYSEEAMKLYEDIKNSRKTSSHLYHSTPADRIQSIVQNGLVVGSKQNQEGVSSADKLYLSAGEELASSFTGDDSVMLRISPNAKLENLDNDLLGGEGSYTITNNIPPQYLQVKEDGKWVNLLKSKYAKNNTKYSLSQDSQGRELSPQQQEFFKDSKIRNNDGQLMEVYHGTSEDFNVFDKSYIGSASGDLGFLGDGFYFATHKGEAAYYGGKNMSVYLNVTNPFNIQSLQDYNGMHLRGVDSNSYIEIKNLVDMNPEWRQIEVGYGYTYGDIADVCDEVLNSIKVEDLGITDDGNRQFKVTTGGEFEIVNAVNDYKTEEVIANAFSREMKSRFGYIKGSDVLQNITSEARFRKINNEAPIKTFSDVLQEKGYDGIIQGDDAAYTDEIVVFNPNQIKNVDNLNPTTNDDIRYMLASEEQESVNNLLKVIESYDDYLKTLPSYQELEQRKSNLDYTDETHGILTKEDYKNKKIDLFNKQIEKADNRMEEQAKRFARENLELTRKAREQLQTIIDKYKGKSREEIFSSNAKQEIKDFVKNNSKQEFVEEYIDEQVRDLQKAIRNTELVISKDNGKEFADGITAFKKNNPGLKIRYGDQNIDSVYQELTEQYPGMLETDVNDKDIPFILADFLKKPYRKFDNSNVRVFELTDNEVDNIANKIYKGLTNNAISDNDVQNMVKQISDKVEEKYARGMATEKYREIARNTIDITDIKDKKRGIQYKVNTMKRNLRDIMSKEQAQLWYDTYFKPITIHNAQSEIDKQSYVERIQKYNLNKYESTYTQMLGELKYNPETDLTTDQVEQYAAQHNVDTQKCSDAVEEFRTIYDELIQRVNESLKANGYKEIDYRKGYFPHFIEDKPSSIIGKLASKFGWNVQKGTLPTDIAGITDQFKPGKAWTSFSQQRTGDTTDYNALKGMDNYLRGAMDLIYHTEDIQKLRALENEIRYQYSSSGVQSKIDEIYANNDLSPEEKAQQIASITENQRDNPLGNLVTELRDYTNALANKKSILDRGMEQSLGRDWYSIMNNINGRVSANMVGMNISSAMTNFIPITQAWSQVSTKNLLKGMYESIKNTFKNDGFDQNSVYLTNRTQQAENLYNSTLDRINQKLGILFEGVDSFTSNTIVRAKYYENLDKGMSEQAAIENADEYAKDVMAGRSKGDQPTIFNTKNPLYKMFTAFQLEVNNQYGYLFKDLPADLGDEAKDKLAMAVMKMFLGAWLYNMISEKITGRKAAFSPIDMIADEYKIATNENLDLATKVQNIAKDLSEETPFIGGIMGGGRLPIQGAIPYENPLSMVLSTFEDASKAMGDDESKKKTAINNLKKEWLKPVYYLALPFAGGQIKKTNEGLAMYNENLPIKGSYTSAGKLRFEADTSPLGIAQAAIFGQYASENAREYFDKGYTPLTEKQINEVLDTNLPISEYRDIKQGIKQQSTTEDKVDYIYNLPIDNEQKNILVNNALNRKTNIDLSNYGDYGSLEEYDYATKNPTKYQTITQITDYPTYEAYKDEINKIKDEYDNTNERKQAVFNYINSLPLNMYQKLMLQKMGAGYSIKSYKNQMHNYIDSLDLTAEQKQQIDNELFG